MPTASRETVRDTMSAVLDVVFDPQPTTHTPSYSSSALLQVRRTLLSAPISARPAPLDTAQLPEWLHPHLRLPPYESRLLARLLNRPSRVIMIRGGSGSGKTSTFGYLYRRCAEAATQLTWSNKYGFQQFFLVIDLQSTAKTLLRQSRPGTQPPPSLVTQMDVLYQELAGHCDSVIRAHLSERNFKALMADTFERVEPGRFTGMEKVQTRIITRLHAERSRHTEIGWSDLVGILDSAETAQDRLIARMLLLARLSDALRSEGKQLVVILDNIDPLIPQLQSEVVTDLASLVGSEGWGSLKIAVPARLSTAEAHIGALSEILEDHECADPVDLVFHRITWSFLASHEFDAYRLAPTPVQHEIRARLFELWRHLVDRRGHLREMLSAMAGTNIRNAFEYARQWCLSATLDREFDWRAAAAEFERSAPTVFSFYAVTELAVAFNLLLDWLFSTMEIEVIANQIAMEDIATASVDRAETFCRAAIAIMENAHIISGEDTFDEDEIRHRACILGRERLALILSQPLAVIRRYTPELAHGFAATFDRLASLGSELTSAFIQQFCADIKTALDAFLKRAVDEDRDVASHIVHWITSTADEARESPVDTDTIARDLVLEHRSDGVNGLTKLESQLFEPKTSRYRAATTLIAPEPDNPAAPSAALNVFSVDGTTISPVVLRILYMLGFLKTRTVTMKQLLDDLHLHGFHPDDIDAALNDMVRVETRLMFSKIGDYYEGIAKWYESNGRVFLSSAGDRYFDHLVAVPPYVQWAFRNIAAIKAEVDEQMDDEQMRSVVGRLEATLIGFKCVVADELERLDALWNRPERARVIWASEIRCYGAAADVFFRTLPRFVYTLTVYQNRLTPRSQHVLANRRVRSLAMQWQALANDWINRHAAYFAKRKNDFWTQMLDSVRDDLRDLTS